MWQNGCHASEGRAIGDWWPSFAPMFNVLLPANFNFAVTMPAMRDSVHRVGY